MTKKSSNDPINKIDPFRQAQTDMRQGYANGSIGIIVSGLIWLISAIITYQYSAKQAVWVLLIGGMFIHPASMLLSKVIGLSGTHTKRNPLGNLALEGTIFMIMCLPLAFGLSLQYVEWFFQGMLLIIGGRYLTFASIYGIRIYWILGAVLGGAAYLLFYFKVQSFGSLLTGSLIVVEEDATLLAPFARKCQSLRTADVSDGMKKRIEEENRANSSFYRHNVQSRFYVDVRPPIRPKRHWPFGKKNARRLTVAHHITIGKMNYVRLSLSEGGWKGQTILVVVNQAGHVVEHCALSYNYLSSQFYN